jgi:hypothetical protein
MHPAQWLTTGYGDQPCRWSAWLGRFEGHNEKISRLNRTAGRGCLQHVYQSSARALTDIFSPQGPVDTRAKKEIFEWIIPLRRITSPFLRVRRSSKSRGIEKSDK